MKTNWYTNEFEQEQNYVSAIYRGYTMSVQDREGFFTEIYRDPASVVGSQEGFYSLKEAQEWAENEVDFITKTPSFDDVSDLGRMRQIRQEIGDLLDEAIEYVEEHALPRARSYWYAHMKIALGGEHEFVGSSMCSMQDTIDEMEGA